MKFRIGDKLKHKEFPYQKYTVEIYTDYPKGYVGTVTIPDSPIRGTFYLAKIYAETYLEKENNAD